MDIDKALRKAVKDAGVTNYRLAKDAELAVSVVQAWARGGGLRLATAEKIASAIGLALTLQPLAKQRNSSERRRR